MRQELPHYRGAAPVVGYSMQNGVLICSELPGEILPEAPRALDRGIPTRQTPIISDCLRRIILRSSRPSEPRGAGKRCITAIARVLPSQQASVCLARTPHTVYPIPVAAAECSEYSGAKKEADNRPV